MPEDMWVHTLHLRCSVVDQRTVLRAPPHWETMPRASTRTLPVQAQALKQRRRHVATAHGESGTFGATELVTIILHPGRILQERPWADRTRDAIKELHALREDHG